MCGEVAGHFPCSCRAWQMQPAFGIGTALTCKYSSEYFRTATGNFVSVCLKGRSRQLCLTKLIGTKDGNAGCCQRGTKHGGLRTLQTRSC